MFENSWRILFVGFLPIDPEPIAHIRERFFVGFIFAGEKCHDGFDLPFLKICAWREISRHYLTLSAALAFAFSLRQTSMSISAARDLARALSRFRIACDSVARAAT